MTRAGRYGLPSLGGPSDYISDRRKHHNPMLFSEARLVAIHLLQEVQTVAVKMPQSPISLGGDIRRLHHQSGRGAPADESQRKYTIVALRLLECGDEVVCLQWWIFHVGDGCNAVSHRLLCLLDPNTRLGSSVVFLHRRSYTRAVVPGRPSSFDVLSHFRAYTLPPCRERSSSRVCLYRGPPDGLIAGRQGLRSPRSSEGHDLPLCYD